MRLLALGRAYVRFAVRNAGRYRLMTGPRLNESGQYPELEEALDAGFRLVILRRIRVRRDSLSAFVDRIIGHTVRGLVTRDRSERPRSR